MRTESDVRMAKFKAAMTQYREGDVSALMGCDITPTELMTISALAKASGDAVTFGLAQRFLNTWSKSRRAEEGGAS